MANTQTLQGSWHEIKGKLKQKWGALTDDELRSFDGNTEQLVGKIQRKTGETRESIEKFLEECSGGASNMLNQAYEAVSQGATQAYDAVSQGASQVGETVQHGYEEAEHLVQQRPAQAVLLSFGVGMVAGLGLAFLMQHDRGHSYDSYWPPKRGNVEQLGRHVLEALARMLPA